MRVPKNCPYEDCRYHQNVPRHPFYIKRGKRANKGAKPTRRYFCLGCDRWFKSTYPKKAN